MKDKICIIHSRLAFFYILSGPLGQSVAGGKSFGPVSFSSPFLSRSPAKWIYELKNCSDKYNERQWEVELPFKVLRFVAFIYYHYALCSRSACSIYHCNAAAGKSEWRKVRMKRLRNVGKLLCFSPSSRRRNKAEKLIVVVRLSTESSVLEYLSPVSIDTLNAL